MTGLSDLWLTHDFLRLSLAGGASAAFALLCLMAGMKPRSPGDDDSQVDDLILYASQTGQAEDIARRGHQRLSQGHKVTRIMALSQVTPALLQNARRILCVVSTTGQGDAPDEARSFGAQVMARRTDLAGRDFAVLALGDRHYADFCAFGRRLYDWLEHCGARPLLACLEADDLDPATLARWEAALTQWGGGDIAEDNRFSPWVLQSRERLNPDSAAAGLYRLRFVPHGDLSPWQAGDLAEIVTPGGHRRDYSIASLPEEGHVALYVRAIARNDGQLGEGSGLLIQNLEVGATVRLRVKSHPGFHSPPGIGPVLLIGAGSGLAGLRAHVLSFRHRRSCWLIGGERHPITDARMVEDIRDWQAEDAGLRLDLAFSQADDGAGRYVQDVLTEKAEDVRDYLAKDGAIMVCGGLDMGLAVDAALHAIMGADWLEAARRHSRYRRDLY